MAAACRASWCLEQGLAGLPKGTAGAAGAAACRVTCIAVLFHHVTAGHATACASMRAGLCHKGAVGCARTTVDVSQGEGDVGYSTNRTSNEKRLCRG